MEVRLASNWRAVVERVLDAHGRIDVLVSNAAICRTRAVHEMPEAAFAKYWT